MPDVRQIHERALYALWAHWQYDHAGFLRYHDGCTTCAALHLVVGACIPPPPEPVAAVEGALCRTTD